MWYQICSYTNTVCNFVGPKIWNYNFNFCLVILSKVLVCTSGKVLFPLRDINILKMEILQCTLLVFVRELNWLKLATLMEFIGQWFEEIWNWICLLTTADTYEWNGQERPCPCGCDAYWSGISKRAKPQQRIHQQCEL